MSMPERAPMLPASGFGRSRAAPCRPRRRLGIRRNAYRSIAHGGVRPIGCDAVRRRADGVFVCGFVIVSPVNSGESISTVARGGWARSFVAILVLGGLCLAVLGPALMDRDRALS